MELQEPVLHAVVSQLKYKLRPRFADVRGELIEMLLDAYPVTEYGWGDTQVQAFEADRTLLLSVGSRDASAHLGRVDDIAAQAAMTRDFLLKTTEMIGVTDVVFVGVRTFWAAATDSFEELNDRLLAVVSPLMVNMLQPYGSATDSGWMFERKGKDPKYVFRLGPMESEQAVTMGLIAEERRVDLPRNFLWLDIDRTWTDATLSLEAALNAWQASFEKSVQQGGRLMNELIDLLVRVD